MIWRRAFFFEVMRTTGVLTLIIGGLLALIGISRLLTEHTALPASATLLLLGLQLTKSTPQLLTASTFAALVIVYGRMFHNGEMGAWRIAGLGFNHWQRAGFVLALPLALCVGILALSTAPWSIRYSTEYLHRISDSLKLEDAPPNLFGEIPSHRIIYHFDGLSAQRDEALGVFIFRPTSSSSLQLIRASRVHTQIENGNLRRIQMLNGQINEIDFETKVGSRISFAAGNLQLGKKLVTDNLRLRARALSDLDNDAAGKTEFWWRIAFIPTMLLLCLLALPLSRVRGLSGRGYLGMLALLAYWLLYAIIGLLKDYGIQAHLPAAAAAFIPTALLLALLLLAIKFDRRWMHH